MTLSQNVALYCLMFLLGCIILNMIRIIKGPSMADRALAADGIFLNMVGISTVYSIFLQTTYYLDLVLVFSLLGFVGIVCFSKFLGRGKVVR